jgi:hypothetical protein
MTRLDDALQALGLPNESELGGTWVTLRGERCRVYVMGTTWGHRYFTWCDDPHDRTVEVYTDPVAALQAGLRRAAYPTPAHGPHET